VTAARQRVPHNTKGRRSKDHRPLLAASLVLSLASVACSPTAPDQQATWGSDQASLTIHQNTATFQILASGGCYGSYGEIENGSRLSGTFALSGTYTELTGVFPGSRQYAAQFTGTVAGNHMTLSVSVPALQQVLGPFTLTSGVEKTWPACRYP
jgi:hypothetical protein